MRGLLPWIEQASKRLHHNMLAIASPTSSPASPGRFSRAVAPNLGDTAAEAQQCGKWAVGLWRRLPVVPGEPGGAPVPKGEALDQ
jgi:hypothetical protein